MTEQQGLAELFEGQRDHLRSVAHRMLGSSAEADDAVQETWLRLDRKGPEGIDNLQAWLTTVVARICLNILRTRNHRAEEPMDDLRPDPVAGPTAGTDPQEEAVLADSVGVALLVVLDTLGPAERIAFVLHDLFGVSFDEIAGMLERTPASARQLACRARRRVRQAEAFPGGPSGRHREVVDAFFAAARGGDFARLISVLDPDVRLHSDVGAAQPIVVRGAEVVARRALMFARPGAHLWNVLVDGRTGTMVTVDGKTTAVFGFTVADDRITGIDVISDAVRLADFDEHVETGRYDRSTGARFIESRTRSETSAAGIGRAKW